MKYFGLIILLFTLSYHLCRDSSPVQMMKNILATNHHDDGTNLFKAFHFLFSKEKEYTLNSEEGYRRLKIFQDNLKFIKSHNAKNLSYKVGINKFADLTREEYVKRHLLEPNALMQKMKLFFEDLEGEKPKKRVVPESKFLQQGFYDVDHRPYLLEPRQQGGCGSCWAFSTMAAIEGNVNRARNQDPNDLGYLSTQQLVDCDSLNYGCSGGWPDEAMEFLSSTGIVSEYEYPYYGQQQQCNVDLSNPRANINDYEYCTNHPYFRKPEKECTRELFHSIIESGPGVVLIDAGAQGFQLYESGVWTPQPGECTDGQENHAVTLVGYLANSDAYLIRNSWGADWGDNGHITIGYDAQSYTCFIYHGLWRPIPQ